MDMNKYDLSLYFYNKSKAIYLQFYNGKKHLDLAQVYNCRGDLYNLMDKYSDAVEEYLEAIYIYTNFYGNQNYNI